MTKEVDIRARELAARTRLQRASRLLDQRWGIPYTRLKFGLDAIIGLIPVVGDVFGGLLSVWVMGEAWRVHVPRRMLLRMFANVLVDVGLGALPLLGDVFDLFWKNNQRNAALLSDYLDKRIAPEPPPRRASRGLIVLVVSLCIFILLWLITRGGLNG